MVLSLFDQVIDRRTTNSLKWSRHPADVLPLWVADMDFPAPEPVRDRLRSAVEHGIFGYELPTRKLSETVAARMHNLYGWTVSPEAVVATPGIVAGFKAAARAVCQIGEGVLIQTPVYHPFHDVAPHAELKGQTAPLLCRQNGQALNYEIDWQAFEAGLNSDGTRTAMFLLCHPHNPIGMVYGKSDLAKMGESCLRAGAVICSDEIHSELLLGGARHAPLAAVDPEVGRRTITLLSPSKTFNLVGLFCGFAIIPDPALRKQYKRVLDHLALHVNSFGLMAAEVAFGGGCEDWLTALRRYLTANRDYLVDFVSRELPGVRTTVPDATYLAWLDFSELVRTGAVGPDPARFLLEKAKVGLNPGAEFGAGAEPFVRLNFGCPRATLAEALSRIRAALVGP